MALLNTHFAMPALLATPIVIAGCGLAALLLGSIVTRASGLALAVATLMLPLIATGYVGSAGYLGGSVGAPLTGNLWNGSSTQSIAIGNGLITVGLLAAVVFVTSRILASDIGLELYVLGVDERTAAAMGVRTPRRKLELFVLGSVLAALGGAVYAGTQLFVPATLVDPTAELALLIMLFVGGRRSVLGAVAGALVIQYLYGASSWVSINILIIEGVLLTAVLLVDPEGLAGILVTLTRRLRAAVPLPALLAPAAPSALAPFSAPAAPTPAAHSRPLSRARRSRPRPLSRARRHTRFRRLSRVRRLRSPGRISPRRCPIAAVHGPGQGLRRPHRTRRRDAGPARPRTVRPVRAERRGEIDAARHRRRQRQPVSRTGRARRDGRHPAAAASGPAPRPTTRTSSRS